MEKELQIEILKYKFEKSKAIGPQIIFVLFFSILYAHLNIDGEIGPTRDNVKEMMHYTLIPHQLAPFEKRFEDIFNRKSKTSLLNGIATKKIDMEIQKQLDKLHVHMKASLLFDWSLNIAPD